MWKKLAVYSLLTLAFISSNLSADNYVLSFAGSAREGSVNKKLASLAAKYASQLGTTATFIDLKDYPIPLYDADLEAASGMPENAKQIRRLMLNSNVIIIASPNYNGSVTALLKNVLDWASVGEQGGYNRDAYVGKKFIILCAAPGGTGGIKGLTHLKNIIENIGGTVISADLAIPKAYQAFDEQGELKDPNLRQKLQQTIQQALL